MDLTVTDFEKLYKKKSRLDIPGGFLIEQGKEKNDAILFFFIF